MWFFSREPLLFYFWALFLSPSSVCMALEGLQETYLKEQRVVDGKLFPLVFKPSLVNQTISLESSQHDLASSPLHIFKQNREFIEHKLDEHGVVFFRGFSLHSASHFNSIVDGFGWRNMSYVGSAPRTRILGSIYTASDANPNVSIPFHHEMSQVNSISSCWYLFIYLFENCFKFWFLYVTFELFTFLLIFYYIYIYLFLELLIFLGLLYPWMVVSSNLLINNL